MTPITIRQQVITPVTEAKLLGVMFSNDMKWNSHLMATVKKCNRRLYFLRLLRRANVEPSIIWRYYEAVIRSVICYGSAVWCNAPAYLYDSLEAIEKKAKTIIGTDPPLPLIPFIERKHISIFKKISIQPEHRLRRLFLPRARRGRAGIVARAPRTSRYRDSFIKYAAKV